ncbi:MAG: phosphoribosylanthranilate isomerase [Hyphomicrobiales bacterium]|nr:phosphoribosylanthranilate isomerase [Hyphomicrobiales bacterium]
MSTGVKICGLRTRQTLDASINAGATHYGLVFFHKSPRNVTLSEAAALADHARGRILSVALTVDASDELLETIVETVRPDMLQLHGAETPERASGIRKRTGLPLIKAISVGAAGDIAAARPFDGIANIILFDAKPVEGRNALPGGNGLTFDWSLLAPVRGTSFMLSGGLTPQNVAEAVRLTGAHIVDVSSGVESAPGIKDPERIRHFAKNARTAALEEISHG